MLRRQTITVPVGDMPLGSNYPVRLQSMTNTNTMDTQATVNQCIRIIDAGSDYVRITAPGIREAENLAVIKKELKQRGYHNPVIADIHFNPQAAEIAARLVEKVRINPGNYTDKKLTAKKSYTDKEYASELGKIHQRILPLIRICKQYGTVIRIGSNHGSLSDRIVNRYGDSPQGMVESAMEFLRIFEDEHFHQIVLSMKASNVKVVIESTRLLAAQMAKENMHYPLHLGVTEAGEGEDGRIKSAVGIGTLLAEGLGDTIRVSLTEDPESEIPVAKTLVQYYMDKKMIKSENNQSCNPDNIAWINENYQLPSSTKLKMIPDDRPVCISDDDCKDPSVVWVIDSDCEPASDIFSNIARSIRKYGTSQPIVFKKKYNDLCPEQIYIKAACDFGQPFLDGLGQGLWIEAPVVQSSPTINNFQTETALSILQACRLRMSKTEYISCPSCGRTLFDLQSTAATIREHTSHLKGLKIGIMGCIVNGPGEMADADYGYVGTGPGKVTLYKKHEVMKRNIPEKQAVDELIELIKEHGDWKNP